MEKDSFSKIFKNSLENSMAMKNHKKNVEHGFEGIGVYENFAQIFYMKQSARNFFS